MELSIGLEEPHQYTTMEPILFPVCVIFLTLLFFFFYAYNSSHGKTNKKLPPGSFGWPFMGETYDFMYSDHANFINHRMQKYSPKIFRTHLYGHPTVVLCGTSGHKFIAANEGKLITEWRPPATQKLFRGSSDSSMVSRESAKHVVRAPLFISREALVAHASVMDEMTRNHFETHWFEKSEVEVYKLVELLTVSIATRLFMGLQDPQLFPIMANCFGHIAQGLHLLPYETPGTTFARAMKGKRRVKSEIMKMIEKKREKMEEGEKASDIMSYLMVSEDPSGKARTDEAVAETVMGLITAAFNSPCIALTFAIMFLAQNPQLYQNIRHEQVEIAATKKRGEALTQNDIQKMKYSWNFLLEVMRVIPPLQGTFREAITDFTYDGFTVPKGWKVYWTVSSINKDPNIFAEPDKLDPTRFESEIPPFLNLPFGGGPRICPGKDFAKLQMLIFLHYVVILFKWELINLNPKFLAAMNAIPLEGVWLRLQKQPTLH